MRSNYNLVTNTKYTLVTDYSISKCNRQPKGENTMKKINVKSLVFNIFSCLISMSVLVALFIFGRNIISYVSEIFVKEGWFYSEALTNQIGRVFDKPYIFFQVPIIVKNIIFVVSCVSTVVTIIITFMRSLISAINACRKTEINNRAFNIISLIVTLVSFISIAIFMIIATSTMWTYFFSSFLNTFITAKITKHIFFFIQVIAVVAITIFSSYARVNRYSENRNENSITLLLSIVGIIIANFVSGFALYIVGMLIVAIILIYIAIIFIKAVFGLAVNN